MATSPLFGWEEPDDVDLVKDGAAAIRTLGNAIDTSMGDLLGGTTGQVLAKASNTNMDFTWVAQDDANAIQNAIVDAKGDLIAATAADTPARLAVGTNGQILTADSTAATGLAWTNPSSSFTGCFVYNSSSQSISNATWTAVAFDAETIDTNTFHDNSTNNSRITIPSGKAGKYSFILRSNAGSYTGLTGLYLYYNGSAVGYTQMLTEVTGSNLYQSNNTSVILDLAVGDYVQAYFYQGSGGSLNVGANLFAMSATYLGA